MSPRTADVPMPLILRLLRVASVICATIGAIGYLPNLALYLFDWANGYYPADDAAIFAREGLNLLLFAPLFVIAVGLSLGLLLERLWTRRVTVLGWAMLLAVILIDAWVADPGSRRDAIVAAAVLLPAAVATTWYLYRSSRATAYYGALATRSKARSA